MKCSFCIWPAAAATNTVQNSVWLHFLTGHGRFEQFYTIIPCKRGGQYRAQEKPISITPMLTSRKKGQTWQINSAPGGLGGAVSLNATCKAGLNLTGPN